MSQWGDVASRYGSIIAGLLLGTAAKYGLALMDGGKVTARSLGIDLLLQGVLGLIAIAISDTAGLTGNPRVFVGALVALNSDRIVRKVRDTFFDRVQSSPLVGGTGAALRDAFPLEPAPADMHETINQIDPPTKPGA